jgi:hypothetical protein
MVDGNSELQSLIGRAKVFNTDLFQDLPDGLHQVLVDANQSQRQLSDTELQRFAWYSNLSFEQLLALRALVDPCVGQTRQALALHHPGLFVAGGPLATPERAQDCWRDCTNFYRVVMYAVAAARPRFCDQQSIDALNELYLVMNVPIDGLAFALRQLGSISSVSFEALYGRSRVAALLQDSFDNLCELLFGGSVTT